MVATIAQSTADAIFEDVIIFTEEDEVPFKWVPNNFQIKGGTLQDAFLGYVNFQEKLRNRTSKMEVRFWTENDDVKKSVRIFARGQEGINGDEVTKILGILNDRLVGVPQIDIMSHYKEIVYMYPEKILKDWNFPKWNEDSNEYNWIYEGGVTRGQKNVNPKMTTDEVTKVAVLLDSSRELSNSDVNQLLQCMYYRYWSWTLGICGRNLTVQLL
jgi:hypothetical protein